MKTKEYVYDKEERIKWIELFQAVYVSNRQIEAVENETKTLGCKWMERARFENALLKKIGLEPIAREQ